MENRCLTLLYNAIKEECKRRHPYDTDMVGQIAEMFLELDKVVIVVSKQLGGVS